MPNISLACPGTRYLSTSSPTWPALAIELRMLWAARWRARPRSRFEIMISKSVYATNYAKIHTTVPRSVNIWNWSSSYSVANNTRTSASSGLPSFSRQVCKK